MCYIILILLYTYSCYLYIIEWGSKQMICCPKPWKRKAERKWRCSLLDARCLADEATAWIFSIYFYSGSWGQRSTSRSNPPAQRHITPLSAVEALWPHHDVISFIISRDGDVRQTLLIYRPLGPNAARITCRFISTGESLAQLGVYLGSYYRRLCLSLTLRAFKGFRPRCCTVAAKPAGSTVPVLSPRCSGGVIFILAVTCKLANASATPLICGLLFERRTSTRQVTLS